MEFIVSGRRLLALIGDKLLKDTQLISIKSCLTLSVISCSFHHVLFLVSVFSSAYPPET
jgi:hypothetical protein